MYFQQQSSPLPRNSQKAPYSGFFVWRMRCVILCITMAGFQKRYNPNRSPDWNYGGGKWRLSRSKLELFNECPRCFYLDNKLGTARPRGPAFTLNIAVDQLFKKEFDSHREKGTPHPIMEEHNLPCIPFKHEDIDVWRENFEGIEYHDPETEFTISGAVDDVWVDTDDVLYVVDYKSTSKEGTIETLADSAWEDQYKRQVGVYQWLLRKNGFDVSDTAYFVYANADATKDSFGDTLHFKTTLVPCEGESEWIEGALQKAKECLSSDEIPASGSMCDYCPYREASGKKLMALFKQNYGS